MAVNVEIVGQQEDAHEVEEQAAAQQAAESGENEANADAGDDLGQAQAAEADVEGGEEENGLTVTIGDAETEQEQEQHQDSAVLRDLRQRYRDLQKRNKELEQEQAAKQQTQQQIVVGVKPTLEGCEWDTDRYDRELLQWQERKSKAEAQQQEAQRQQEEIARNWNAKLASYGERKAALKVADYDDAEESVQASLTQVQQAIILQGAKDPALMVYALGKNSSKLKKLSAIKDPVQFAVAVGELGKEINVKPRKTPPAPEKRVTAAGAPAKSMSESLDAARAKAAKTGDYSEVLRIKAAMKKA